MKPLIRKIIFFIFLGTFLVSAPTVVLYTAGYRLNLTRFSLVKTGIFSLSTTPKGAMVILDNQKTNKETPVVFDNIMPGEHIVRFEKEGYLPWEKKLVINENETTFVQKTVLFLSTGPELIVADNFTAPIFDQLGENLAFAKKEEGWVEVWYRDLTSAEERLLLRLPSNNLGELKMFWSDDATILYVIETKNFLETWRTVDMKGNSQTIEKPLARWQRDTNQLLSTTTTDDNETALLLRYQTKPEQTIALLPKGNYEFLFSPPTMVLLHDRARKKIVLVDDRGVDQPILLNTEANLIMWDPQNKTKLLYASDFELHIYDAEKHTDELLTRVSSPITNLAWHPNGSTIFYSETTNVYAMELDSRNGRNIFNLANLNKLETFAIGKDSASLYLIGENEKGGGLFVKKLMD